MRLDVLDRQALLAVLREHGLDQMQAEHVKLIRGRNDNRIIGVRRMNSTDALRILTKRKLTRREVRTSL